MGICVGGGYMADGFRLRQHDKVGYAPKPGFHGSGAGGWTVTIDADGLRTCGDPPGGPSSPSALPIPSEKGSATQVG
jgi:hypothetical protein